MSTTIKPLHDRVIVKRTSEVESMTPGGLHIPEVAKEKPLEGIVFAVGDGAYQPDGTRRKLDVKKGDTVLFGKFSGSDVKLDGENYLIMREDEILAVLEKENSENV